MPDYLTTGGAGFIGSHLVDLLLERGNRVRVVDDLSTGSRRNLSRNHAVEFLQGDVRDPAFLAKAIGKVDGVFHLAAISSVERSVLEPEHVHSVNVSGTLSVLEASRRAGVKRLVFVSSASAYGDCDRLPLLEDCCLQPLSPYGASKVAGEVYVGVFHRLGFLETVILRPFNIFGPRQDPASPYSGVISIFARNAISGEKPQLFGDGKQTRDFLYVGDLCHALLLAMETEGARGQVINIASGRETTIQEVGETIFRLRGSRFEPQFMPPRAGDIRRSLASIERAKEVLGWEPRISLEDGLRRTLDWLERSEKSQSLQ